jgi:hypothetical protein
MPPVMKIFEFLNLLMMQNKMATLLPIVIGYGSSLELYMVVLSVTVAVLARQLVPFDSKPSEHVVRQCPW